MNIGKHKIVSFRLDQNEAGAVVYFNCEDEIVMEVSLPSNCIKLISKDDQEYINIRSDGVFTAHINSSTYQTISDYFVEYSNTKIIEKY